VLCRPDPSPGRGRARDRRVHGRCRLGLRQVVAPPGAGRCFGPSPLACIAHHRDTEDTEKNQESQRERNNPKVTQSMVQLVTFGWKLLAVAFLCVLCVSVVRNWVLGKAPAPSGKSSLVFALSLVARTRTAGGGLVDGPPAS